MAKTKSKSKVNKAKRVLRRPLTETDRRKLLTRDVQLNFPDNMNPMMSGAFKSMISGMDIELEIPTLYSLIHFMHEDAEELKRVRMAGFQELWESKGNEELQVWNFAKGSILTNLGYDMEKRHFIGSQVIEDSVGDLLRISQTLFKWDVAIQYTMMEYKGDKQHLKNILDMTHDQVAQYATDNDLNFGTVELDVNQSERLHGVHFHLDDADNELYTLSALHNITMIEDGEEEKVPTTILGYAFNQIRHDVTMDAREHEEFKNYEVVNFTIKAKVAGF